MLIEKRLEDLGITLPQVPNPVGTYVPAVQMGNLLFLGGQGPLLPSGENALGKLGDGVTVAEGYDRARLTGLYLIAVMKETLGDLDRVKRIGKVLGMVNCVPSFGDTPGVINGCSDLFLEVFGEKGRHARSSVGMSTLPGDMTVEIECIVEVEA